MAQDAGTDATGREALDILRRMEPALARVDERLKALEAKGDKAEADMRALREGVVELKGRVASLPNTVQLLGFVLATLLAGGLLKFFFG